MASEPKLFWVSCILDLGLVGVRIRIMGRVSIMGRIRGKVRVSLGGSFRFRVRFWPGPGTRLDPRFIGCLVLRSHFHPKRQQQICLLQEL